jgi:ABC-type transport system involved in multi-copper enzyme maturation permease subunit
MSVHSSPARELARHFFREFFYLGFLTDAGADSFIRLMISILAGVLSLSILLPLLFFQKYVALTALNDPEHYRQAILGDQLFMLCVAMFIIASVGTAVCQSMFPSETDFRILTPLPVTRRAVFGAKLLALAVFTAVFVLVTIVATGPVGPAVSGGRWTQVP